MTDTEAPARRHYLTKPGESLLMSLSAIDLTGRAEAYARDTGLPPEDIVLAPVVTVPMPVRVSDGADGVMPWEGDWRMLWHPLCWLPASAALRLVVEDEMGESRGETDDEWALRVALEMIATGLYDTDEGWLDILAAAGLDLENPLDAGRVEAWAAGEADEQLDAIDLTSMFSPDPAEPFAIAHDLLAVYLPASRGISAGSLLAELDEHTGTFEDEGLALFAAIALHFLDDVPESDGEYPEDVLLDVMDALEQPDHRNGDLVQKMALMLQHVRDDYAWAVEGIRQAEAAAGNA